MGQQVSMMDKRRATLKYLLRLVLEIAAWEAAFLGVSWLLHRYWVILQRFSFADVLFFTGALAGTTGAVGLMRSPYRQQLSPWGVFASSVNASEEEKRSQMVYELMHQLSFGLHLVAVGVITILLSVLMTVVR